MAKNKKQNNDTNAKAKNNKMTKANANNINDNIGFEENSKNTNIDTKNCK